MATKKSGSSKKVAPRKGPSPKSPAASRKLTGPPARRPSGPPAPRPSGTSGRPGALPPGRKAPGRHAALPPKHAPALRPTGQPAIRLQLRYLAHARSGDKGDTANVGLIALRPEWYPILVKEVTKVRVLRHFKYQVSGVDRYELPNLNALNFLLHGALDGGGTLSLKTDAQGKVYSTALLRMEIKVPAAVAREALR